MQAEEARTWEAREVTFDPLKPKWCPFVRKIVYYFTDDGTEMLASGNRTQYGSWHSEEACIGPDCMAWRSQGEDGYCGLAGPP